MTMGPGLRQALEKASPARIADAFDAAIHAAYTSTTAHGYAAALEVLNREPGPGAPPTAEPPTAVVETKVVPTAPPTPSKSPT